MHYYASILHVYVHACMHVYKRRESSPELRGIGTCTGMPYTVSKWWCIIGCVCTINTTVESFFLEKCHKTPTDRCLPGAPVKPGPSLIFRVALEFTVKYSNRCVGCLSYSITRTLRVDKGLSQRV